MRKCSICGAKHSGKGYCKKHYDLIVRGPIIEAWRTKNMEKRRTAVRKWRAKNKDKNRQLSAAWKRNHPKTRLANEHARRARKASVGGRFNAQDILRLFVFQHSRCAVCSCDISKSYHIDHVLPIKHGGSNDRLNLQLLCESCNLHKAGKHPIAFMQEKGFLL